jgi:hypothetical protein
MSKTTKTLSFDASVADSTARNYPYQNTKTTKASYDSSAGIVGTKGNVPKGSQTESGRFTGDFRGLGVVNPWGGKKSRRRRNIKKRKTRRLRTKRRR